MSGGLPRRSYRRIRAYRPWSGTSRTLRLAHQSDGNSLTTSFRNASRLTEESGLANLAPFPDVDEMAGDRRRRRHCRRDQMGAALEALSALEIAVRGRGAALLRH